MPEREPTRVDRLIERFNNHKIASIVVLACVLVIGAGAVANSVLDIKKLLFGEAKPAANGADQSSQNEPDVVTDDIPTAGDQPSPQRADSPHPIYTTIDDAVDNVKASSEQLPRAIADLKTSYDGLFQILRSQSQAAGRKEGLTAFLTRAYQVQSRFDEGEANRGRDSFNASMAQHVQSWTAAEQADLSTSRAAIASATATLEKHIGDAQSSLETAKTAWGTVPEEERLDESISENLALIQQHFERAENDVKATKDALASLENVHKTISRINGIVDGATNYQTQFFDIMFSMDREEARWARSGGDDRAPAGGYKAVVDREVVAPARATVEAETKKQQPLTGQIDGSTQHLREAIAAIASRAAIVDTAIETRTEAQ